MKNETIRHSRFFAVPVFLSIAVMLIFPCSVFPQNTYIKDPSYAESIAAKSRQMKLSEERYWLVLGHDRKGTFGYKSQVDVPRFFSVPTAKKIRKLNSKRRSDRCLTRTTMKINTAQIVDLSAVRQYGEWSKEASAYSNIYF